MPKEGTHTPISDEEAEEFAKRMTQSENIEVQVGGQAALENQTMWEDFVANRILEERGTDASPATLAMAERGRVNLLRAAIRSFLG